MELNTSNLYISIFTVTGTLKKQVGQLISNVIVRFLEVVPHTQGLILLASDSQNSVVSFLRDGDENVKSFRNYGE